jgi:predicted enzyme related to lactoylglutathione lyase
MKTLHHLALGARDVARVAEFYQAAFGLQFDREHRKDDGTLRSIWLRTGSLLLMIEHTEVPTRRVDGVGRGPFLLAFTISASEREGVEALLELLGAPIESRTDFTSYARDPEGNRIAVSHFPAESPG